MAQERLIFSFARILFRFAVPLVMLARFNFAEAARLSAFDVQARSWLLRRRSASTTIVQTNFSPSVRVDG